MYYYTDYKSFQRYNHFPGFVYPKRNEGGLCSNCTVNSLIHLIFLGIPFSFFISYTVVYSIIDLKVLKFHLKFSPWTELYLFF